MYAGPGRSQRTRAAALALIFMMSTSIVLIFDQPGVGFRDLGDPQTISGIWKNMGNLSSIGDLNQDGKVDLVLTLPEDPTYGIEAGTVYLFWGKSDGFSDLHPSNADITFHGNSGFRMGTAVTTWDLQGNGWEELVIGCPGANGSSGRALIFNQVQVNGADFGTVYGPEWAYIELNGQSTNSFGGWISKGNFTGSDYDDLVVLSSGNDTTEPQAHLFMGGGVPGLGVNMTLPTLSVSPTTQCVSLDLMGRGMDALVYSSPDRAMLRIAYFTVEETVYHLPGANSTGVVDFQGSIQSSGNTYGWGAGDDGWDTSGSDVFDPPQTPNSLRFNQATGNARGHNRSIENVSRLEIEIGGVSPSTSVFSESGAYGVSFQLSPSDLIGKNSAVLSFDYIWEDWGFEMDERMWIKGRITNGDGDSNWLGSDLDFNPAPDTTPEIWTIRGVNSGGSGIFMSGMGHYEEEILSIVGPSGEHYLELGGKISRWTNSVECGAVGFDNITLGLRSLEMDITTMTGANGLGSKLLAEDIDGDGSLDLASGNPKQNRVRIYHGNDPYWDSLSGFNEDKANMTITGDTGSDFGRDMIVIGASAFTPMKGLFISLPAWSGGPPNGTGAIVRYDLPMEEGVYTLDEGLLVPHDENEYAFGLRMVPIGDPEEDGYPNFIFLLLDGSDKLVIKQYDRGPNYPELRLNSPPRGVPLSGTIEIKATMSDLDLDATPWDIKFYRSIDNRSWSPVGNGTPDKVEGQSAIKYWDTTTFENRLYFLKVEVTDSFGLSIARYSNSIQVLNHRAPNIFLTYPADGTVLSGNVEITARVFPPPQEFLAMPVRFLMSRDGENWTEFANRSSTVPGSDVDYSTILDTENLQDGEIWFKINSSTEFGLGAEEGNSEPCIIDNYYSPEIEFLGEYSGNLSGVINVTVKAYDKDLDLDPPVQLFIKDPDVLAWDLLGEFRGPIGNWTYFYNWDTTGVENGEYNLMVRARDVTFNEAQEVLSGPVWIHNPYTPTITIVNIDEGSILSGIPRIRIQITDRDMNFNKTDVKLFYRDPDVGIWNRISPVLVIGANATVDWDTTILKNKEYDLRAEVTDRDNLSAFKEVLGVIVKNLIPPTVQGELFTTSGPIKGERRIAFNITDDEPVSIENITVEVFVFSGWVEIGPSLSLDPEAIFIPGKNVSFYVDWNTLDEDEFGNPLFPDGPGYEIRITYTDPDAQSQVWRSVISYSVSNKVPGGGSGPNEEGSSIDPGLLAIMGLIAVVVVVLLVVGLFIWRGNQSERKGSIPDIEEIRPKKETEPAREEEMPSYYQEREGGIYSPPGWGTETSVEPAPATTAPFYSSEEAGAFMSDVDEIDASPGRKTDLLEDIFGEEEKTLPRKKPRKQREELSLEVELPTGAMPSRAKDEPEDWAEAEEWDEEEEAWEEFEELEDDDDEWEDEEEEDILVVTCKCGNEVEISSSGDGRFSCEECGRKGRVKV